MLESALDLLRSFTNPERLIALLSTVLSGWLGYAVLIAIVFAETGLLVGFFLPGDSLLFTVGVVAGAGELNIVLINIVLMAAAIIGDGVGFHLGRHTGPAIFSRPDSRLFKQEYLHRTQAFYDKHGGKTIIYARFVPIIRTFAGGKTIIYARFVPIIRTFAPFVAGVAGMNYGRFLMFNVFGGIGWVFLLTMLGYFLGEWAPVRAHFEKVILGIIFVSVLPVVLEFWKSHRRA